MKILYGVQTTGNGHLVRSAAVIEILRDLGHKVFTLFSGDENKKIWDLSFFEPCSRKKGLTFATKQGKLLVFKTARQLDFIRFYKDIHSFTANRFDLVITDYEPVTARIARKNKIPSIGIGHLYSFCHQVPVSKATLPGTKWIMTRFAPVDIPLGLHWHHFGQPILPPTIPKEVKSNCLHEKDKVLVYLPFEDLEQTKNCLRPIQEYRFFIYCSCQAPYQEGNLELRPFSRKGFLQDLAQCSGVICNSGFSLVSEALHLGKKVLVKPLAGQIEQSSNAKALKLLGLGSVMQELNPSFVKKFLQGPCPDRQNYPDVITPLARWIDSGDWKHPEELVQSLWQ